MRQTAQVQAQRCALRPWQILRQKVAPGGRIFALFQPIAMSEPEICYRGNAARLPTCRARVSQQYVTMPIAGLPSLLH